MIVGIDLGTSTSEIAILRNGTPQILRDIGGSSHGFLPSVVAVDSDGRLAIGEAAVKMLTVRPDAAAAEIKRLMGTDARVQLGADSYRPEEIAAFILKHLKQEAERALGEPVSEVIITVPAYFTAVQRRATQEAAELAGLAVRRLINEPTAAALAYGLERPGIEEKIVVYDLGGGTLDVTVLDLSEGVLDVLASTGNAALGGKDFDYRLMRYLRDACMRECGVDLTASPTLQARLKAAAKRAKEDLSSSDRTSVVLDNLELAVDGTAIHWEHVVTREVFDAEIHDLVLSTRMQLDEALAVKRLSQGDITTVVLVGGSTRVPLVRDFVSEYFGGRVLRTEVHPDEAVALGAAVLGGIETQSIDASRLVVTDVAPWTLGVAVLRTNGGQKFSGMFDPLILKQTTIPRTVARQYKTTCDWQDAVHVQVYQGDAPRCSDNIFVGDFQLEDIKQVPAGAPIDIEFSYNLSGELEVSARRARPRSAGRHATERGAPRAGREGWLPGPG